MKTNKFKVFLNIFLALSLAIVASACDSNFAHPDALMTDDSIRIDYFEPELDELTVGQTTTLKWSVIDDNDTIDYCNVEPGIGPVGETNSVDITPELTTTYTLTVVAGGEIVKQQSKIVKVYSPSGDEIVDGTTLSETCDDGIDNDSDTFVDCDDEDCVSDEACADTTFTPEFSYTLSDETPLIGDSVTISWESNYNSLNLYYTQGLADDSEFIKPYQATSSLTFTVEAETTTFKFNAYDSEDNYSGTEEITVTATEEEEDTTNPGFSATIDYFDVYPSVYLIQNEPYYIDWCVRNAASVDMTGDTDHCDTISNLSAGNYETNLYLTVIDIYGNPITRPKNLFVSSFDDGNSFLSATITKMIPGLTTGEYYFITSDNNVYKSENYLDKTTVTKIVSTSDLEPVLDLASSVGTISAFAVNNDENYFIGTDKALFVKDADGFKEAVTSDGQTFNSIVVTKNGTVLAGATKNYGTIHAATDEADNDGWDTTLLAFTSYATTDPVRFYQFVVNPNDRSELVALTDKGAFYSTDNGSTFVAKTTDDITVAGFWSEEGKLLVWSHNNVYEWDSSDKRFDEKSALEISSSQINYAVKQKNRYFVATSSGVAVYNPNYEYAEKFYAISGFEVKFLIMGDSDGSFNTPSIHGLTGNGIDYLLEWQSASSYRGIFGSFNLGTFRR